MLRCEDPYNCKQALGEFYESKEFLEHADWEDEIGDLIKAYFEYGQIYIMCMCGAAWSVNDLGDDEFCFEQVSEGDEEYHKEEE